jgi:tetratricopeptide (TPR) repeat protein
LGRVEEAIECFEKALAGDPFLVEAHLSKANALHLFLDDPKAAIFLYEKAYQLQPDLDRAWIYVRYWYSFALLSANEHERALEEVERGLLLHSGDIHYLNQKAAVLSEARKTSDKFEATALEFFQFRAHAISNDFPGLDELIQIYSKRGKPEEAWAFIEVNLSCEPFSLRDIAFKAGISLEDFQIGFRQHALYRSFRSSSSLADHQAYLNGFGLKPNSSILKILGYVLMAPFGVMFKRLSALSPIGTSQEAVIAFEESLATISKVFPIFGSLWLSSEKPEKQEDQIKILSLGIAYLPDIVVAEVARHFGFLIGCLKFPETMAKNSDIRNLKSACAEVAVNFFEQVAGEWKLASDCDGEKGSNPNP